MTQQDKNFIKLIQRSPDHGNGWRQVSDLCWELILEFKQPDLIEIDTELKRVRLSHDGTIVAKYL